MNFVVAPERPDTVRVFRELHRTHGVNDSRDEVHFVVMGDR
jgi:hypothetical protein